jgi:hypothetical protein
MATPDFEKYGYRPDHDGRNMFSYVNENYEYGLPYRIGASENMTGGWVVWVQWRPDAEGEDTVYGEVEGIPEMPNNHSQRDTRFDAAMMIERAMEEYSPSNYGPSGGSITGGL